MVVRNVVGASNEYPQHMFPWKKKLCGYQCYRYLGWKNNCSVWCFCSIAASNFKLSRTSFSGQVKVLLLYLSPTTVLSIRAL